MRRFFSVIFIAAVFSGLPLFLYSGISMDSVSAHGEAAVETVEYLGTVEHFFTHCLIAYPELAFKSGNPMGKSYDRDCLTPAEFKGILSQMYKNGYTLVNIFDTYEVKNGRAVKKPFTFPKGRRPMVLSFDDVVYDSKKSSTGMVDRLVVDGHGIVAAYTASAKQKLSYDNEFIPILESFVKEHPDFSYNNARGIICLTGFDGVLGYRTYRDSVSKASEGVRAKEVADVLKKTGWVFASHSYSHGHMKKYDVEKMRDDAEKWKNEVEPIVGKTELYVYPYGEWVLGENCSDGRHGVLAEYGYKVFFGVGSRAFYQYMPLKSEKNSRVLFMDRCPMDGIALRQNGEAYAHVFDCKGIYDGIRPVAFA